MAIQGCGPLVGIKPVFAGHRHTLDGCLEKPFPLDALHCSFSPEFGARAKRAVVVTETQRREKTLKQPRHRQTKRMDRWA